MANQEWVIKMKELTDQGACHTDVVEQDVAGVVQQHGVERLRTGTSHPHCRDRWRRDVRPSLDEIENRGTEPRPFANAFPPFRDRTQGRGGCWAEVNSKCFVFEILQMGGYRNGLLLLFFKMPRFTTRLKIPKARKRG